MKTGFLIFAGCSALLAAYAVFAERRRSRRRDLDRVGWVPWTLVQVIAILFATVGVALALKL